MQKKSAVATAYEITCQSALGEASSAFAALEKVQGDKTLDTVLQPLNALWMTIDRGMNTAALYSAVHPDPGVREVADTCEQEFRKIVTKIELSRPLFEAVSAMDVSGADAVTQRYVAHLLRDFRRAGVDKDEQTRAEVARLKEELVKIGQEFGRNIREDQRSIKLSSVDDLKGLPQDYIDAHPPGEDGKITITTNYPDYQPFMEYAENDEARRRLYVEFRKRAHPQNIQVLQNLLAKRHQLATLLGYEDWADYVTEDKMIKTEEAARAFINRIKEVAQERSASDYQVLLARLQQDQPGATEVSDWQKTYLEHKIKTEQYQVDAQEVRQYFTYTKVRDGLLALTSKLFDVEYRPVRVPVWHDSVTAYEVVENGEVIGRFYLDMHPRADKYQHAAAFPIVTGVAGKQVPEAALVCNFPAAGPMEHGQVETFFHEFGHLLHHIFGGKQPWLGVSGFNTEWDFVEVPSQIFEEWAWNAETLRLFATNEAGEPIPDTLVAAMNEARNFGKGLWVSHQMFYAAVSLTYYDNDPTGMDTTAVMKELQNEYSPFKYVDDTYFQLSFGHLDGYSAIYYGYMWALVIAKDMFSKFQEQGLLNPEVAAAYREKVLAPGGSQDASDMVRNFLGREYTFDAFASWLNE